MSTRELRRAEVLGRVKSHTLRLVDAAKMLELSYRQGKRIWARYRGGGGKALQHGNPRALYTDWKNVYASAQCAGAAARRSGGDPVWTHVRRVGHPHHRR